MPWLITREPILPDSILSSQQDRYDCGLAPRLNPGANCSHPKTTRYTEGRTRGSRGPLHGLWNVFGGASRVLRSLEINASRQRCASPETRLKAPMVRGQPFCFILTCAGFSDEAELDFERSSNNVYWCKSSIANCSAGASFIMRKQCCPAPPPHHLAPISLFCTLASSMQ